MSDIQHLINDAQIQEAMSSILETGEELGLHAVAYHRGRKVVDVWGGVANPDTGQLVAADTLFNVYSVSKAVTATALHIQAERGLVDYNAPIASYWPEFAANGKAAATVRHGLTHRIGIPQMPTGVTVEQMCDWDWMADKVAGLEPLFPVGHKTAYQPLTYGWILGEIVRRTDPERRDFRQFVHDEIATPLGLKDFWLGIDDEVEPRIAKLDDRNAGDPPPPLATLYLQALPPAVALVPEVFERPDVRRACIPAVGGIFNARDEARFWAMLAQGGELDGVRLLSQERVASFSTARENSDEPDPVMFGYPLSISSGGYWLGNPRIFSDTAIWHPGAGGSIGWADSARELAVAVCHNRMFNAPTIETDPIYKVTRAIIKSLGLEQKR